MISGETIWRTFPRKYTELRNLAARVSQCGCQFRVSLMVMPRNTVVELGLIDDRFCSLSRGFLSMDFWWVWNLMNDLFISPCLGTRRSQRSLGHAIFVTPGHELLWLCLVIPLILFTAQTGLRQI